ncbi:PHD finger protein 13-like [Uloborus diversus]|uniref:PHD finger protein 13-like n=1 Tax=Uloborus diversus TaxID=327109 RepID=UPI00240A6365|nr:PHD finger protein 13-like [Uloborus diversus]
MFDSRRHFDMDEFFQSRKTKREDYEDEPSRKEQRTSNQLLLFCDLILKYEKYKPHKEEMHDSAYSPSSSERSADSYSSESNSSFTSNRISSENGKGHSTDTDDDSWDLITCHCMKPFAGRPMIECTMCESWIHMSCAKIRRNNIPEDFICQLCREAKGSKRRSERIRSDDRRLLA